MKAFTQILFRSRYYLLALTGLLLVLGSQPLMRALEVNNSLEIWFDEDAPALEAYRAFNRQFGSDELVIIVATAPNGWLDSRATDGLRELSAALDSIPEVQHLHSAANTKALQFTGLGLTGKPLMDGSSKEIQARLERMPELKAQLFNTDYTATRLIVQFSGDLPMDSIRGELIDRVKSTAARHWPRGQLAFGGVGVIFSGLNALTETQFGQFVGIAYVLMLFLLWFLFRSWRVSLLALSTMSLATIFSLIAYGLAGHQLNLMTVLIPMVVLLLSTMDVIHLVYAWFRTEGMGKERLEGALQEVWKPCLFTTLTTMAGFLALLFSPMAILQQFGLFSAMGIGLSLVFTWLLATVLLPGFSPKRDPKMLQTAGSLTKFLYSKRYILRPLALILVLASSAGLFFLENDTYTLGYLPDDHEVVKDHNQITETWGPYMPLELMVSSPDGRVIHNGTSLQESIEIHRLLQSEGYTNLFGFTSLFMAAGKAYGFENDSTTVAASDKIERQLTRHYPELWRAYLNDDAAVGRITLFGEMRTAGELERDMQDLMEKVNAHADQNLQVKPAGYLPLYAELVPYVTSSQIGSLLLAALFIGLLMWMYFKRWKLALIALFTNAFPLLGMFGLMGWFGINIDIATASIGAIGLSFCVDDSIHFTAAWQRRRKDGLSVRDAIDTAYHRTGRAIVLSSLVLCLGFSVMLFSPLKTVFLFGLLTCVMIVLALFAQLVVFPLLVGGNPKIRK